MNAKIEIIFNDGSMQHPRPRGDGFPLFLGDDGVDGTVVVSGPDLGAAGGPDSLKITLEGDLLNVISLMDVDWPSSELYRMQMGQKLLHLTDNRVLQDSNGADNAAASFPFHFDIPRQILTPNGLKPGTDLVQSLPSSVHVSFDNCNYNPHHHGCRGKSNVNYRLRAQVVKAGNIIAEAARPISLYPTLQKEPPVCTSDFPGEYALSASKTIRTFLTFRRMGVLCIETSEPSPFEFHSMKDDASTTINIRLRYRPIHGHVDGIESLKPVYATVNSKLQSTTFVSVVPRQRLPTCEEADKSPFVTKHCSTHMRHKRKLRFAPWRQAVSKEGTFNRDPPSAANQEWESEATLVVEYTGDDYPEPTFMSSLVSRRYTLHMHVEVEWLGHHTTFELQVPVQVRYKSKPSSRPQEVLQSSVDEGTTLQELSDRVDTELQLRDGPPIYVA
ncbi:hypothetical protein VTN00DRAFT_8178 [Thermoascus crustaceus]|uniref:uncharacterized protein n=1 Tax=Thermoascus crustaceus TaxID=5088 RepID=UPI00374218AB